MSGTRNAKYCAKLVSAVELLLSAALSRSGGVKSLSCSREWSQMIISHRPNEESLGEKPRRSPAALECSTHVTTRCGLHAPLTASPHVTTHVTVFGLNLKLRSGRAVRRGAATAVYRNSFSKIDLKGETQFSKTTK